MGSDHEVDLDEWLELADVDRVARSAGLDWSWEHGPEGGLVISMEKTNECTDRTSFNGIQ